MPAPHYPTDDEFRHFRRMFGMGRRESIRSWLVILSIAAVLVAASLILPKVI